MELKKLLEQHGQFDDYVAEELSKNPRPTLILPDRGIRQALTLGYIRPNTIITPKQIQPASFDLRIHSLDELGPVSPGFGMPSGDEADEMQIRAYAEVRAGTVETFDFHPDFQPIVIARSSLGRFGVSSVDAKLYKGFVRLGNYSPNRVQLEQGQRAGNIVWTVSYDPYMDEDLLKHCEFGVEITNRDTLEKMLNAGVFGVDEPVKFRSGMLEIHASDEVYTMKKVDLLDMNNRPDDMFEPAYQSPHLPKGRHYVIPGNHTHVIGQQTVDLSDKVAIWFVTNPWKHLNRTGREKMRAPHVKDTNMLNSGWFDPGYKGGYSGNTKTSIRHGHMTSVPGDVIGLGRIFYFPKGVEHPYGSAKKSSWQGITGKEMIK